MRGLKAELEVARLEKVARDIRGAAEQSSSSYISTHLPLFLYLSLSLPLDFQIFIFSYQPPTSASAPFRFGAATAVTIVGGCNGLRGNTVTLVSPQRPEGVLRVGEMTP